MKTILFWMLLLCSLLVACANNPEQPQTVSYRPASNEVPVDDAIVEPALWPYPEQERWIEEPVFEGKLHLAEAGKHH